MDRDAVDNIRADLPRLPAGKSPGKRPRYMDEDEVSGSQEERELPDVHVYLDGFNIPTVDRISILRGLANYYAAVRKAGKKASNSDE